MTDVNKEASTQITDAIGAEWTLNDGRFEWIRPWNYLLIQLKDSENALISARKFNDDASLTKDEQLLFGLSLFRSSIISYGKCFAETGKGRTSLDYKQVFLGHSNLTLIHERIIKIRNSFVAHNGENDLDISTVATLETPEKIVIKHLYTVAHPLDEYDGFMKAIVQCQSYVVLAVNKHLDSLERTVGKPIQLAGSTE